MQHYYGNPVAGLCPPKAPANLAAVHRLLGATAASPSASEEAVPPSFLPRIRALPSLRRLAGPQAHLYSVPGLEVAAADLEEGADGLLRALLPRVFLSTCQARIRARVAMALWHETSRAAAGGRSGSSSSSVSESSASSRRQLYLEYLSGTLLGGASHNGLLSALRLLRTDALKSLGEKWVEQLESEDQLFRDDAARLRGILQPEPKAAGGDEQADGPSKEAGAAKDAAQDATTWSAAKRRRVMLATATGGSASPSATKASMAKHAALESALNDFFRVFCEENLKPPSRLPLHETFLFGGSGTLAQMLSPPIRKQIQRALSDPQPILQCECCVEEGTGDGAGPSDKDKDKGKAPAPKTSAKAHCWDDLTLAYDIFSKSGRLVSLADWFVSFSEAKQAANLDLKELQARFYRSVKELDFLGYIRPTKRRPDHVEKALFGLP